MSVKGDLFDWFWIRFSGPIEMFSPNLTAKPETLSSGTVWNGMSSSIYYYEILNSSLDVDFLVILSGTFLTVAKSSANISSSCVYACKVCGP